MEFFEQAHVAKSMKTTKNECKSEETVKKQLKQMLYGYKKSDNDLIKNAVDINIIPDDSSSVSGFSDLNLSVSSGADDTTRATIGSPDDSILDDLNVDLSPKITDLSLDSDNEQKSISLHSDSVDISSTSVNLCLDIDDNSSLNSEIKDDELSFIGSPIKSLTDIESSQEFDSDGLLASKIHEKLKSKNHEHVNKRQLEKDESDETDVVQTVKFSRKNKKIKSPRPPQILHPSLLEEDTMSLDISLNESTFQSNTTNSSTLSPPYVALNATEIQQENFHDVLGKYKHSVIKNIPYDNNELIFSDAATSFYSANEMTIDEEDMEEEITYLSEADILTTNDDDVNPEEIILSNIESGDKIIEESIENIEDTVQSAEPINLSKNILEDSVELLFKGNVCVCVMKHPAKMYVNGKLKVRCLGGVVEVFGHTLTEKPTEVYAPYSNFAQCLATVEKNATFYGLFSKLSTLGLSVTEAENIVTTIRENDAVLVIEPLKSVKMDFIEKHFSVSNLFIKSNKHVDNCHPKALEKLGCFIHTSQPRKVFEVPPSWQEVNKYCYKEQSRGILSGGKGVGKSTCLRYHVNKLLAQGPVLVIDLDIGQSEFTVAGNISATVVKEPLLGPNFTHLRKPERTLNLGMINPLDNMTRYVSAVVRLIAYCVSDERLRTMRWLVNTMGLCNVVGLDFIITIILHCQPTYLLQIDSKNVKKRFDIFLRPHLVAAHYEQNKNRALFANTACPDNLNYDFILFHHTESPVKNNNSLAPRDERYLNFLAYFSDLLHIHNVSNLLEITPYE